MGDERLRFEHQVTHGVKGIGGRWLVAVSGGIDSMVLIEVLRKWSRLLKIELAVAHVHHGVRASKSQKSFRDRAQSLVDNWCNEHEISFLTNEAEDVELKSEADLRSYRLQWLERWKKESSADFMVFAHHRDDLLETRILRLIRGTGPVGLKSMQIKSGSRLRPLLEVSRTDIEDYAQARALKFISDPSNSETHALRNWLRKEWLPALEKKRPGSAKALARSLQLMSENAVVESSGPERNVGLRRDLMTERTVADYFRSLGLKNYGQKHVREVLKRSSGVPKTNRQKFTMLGVVFEITQDLLQASRV